MCDVEDFGRMSKEDKVELFKAWVDGECIETLFEDSVWIICKNPGWVSWAKYRIKPKPAPTKPSVDWGALDKKFRYMFKTPQGRVYVAEAAPVANKGDLGWFCLAVGDIFEVTGNLSSVGVGTCHWLDSLVKRPEGVR